MSPSWAFSKHQRMASRLSGISTYFPSVLAMPTLMSAMMSFTSSKRELSAVSTEISASLPLISPISYRRTLGRLPPAPNMQISRLGWYSRRVVRMFSMPTPLWA